MIAEKKSLTLEQVWCAVRRCKDLLGSAFLLVRWLVDCLWLGRCCGGPVLNSTKTETVRFHDDKSLYTGTHAQGGPDPGRKGKGTLHSSQLAALSALCQSEGRLKKGCARCVLRTWTTALRDEPSQASTPVPSSPRDPEYSREEPEKRPRSVSLSEKKISQQLRGKGGTVEAGLFA